MLKYNDIKMLIKIIWYYNKNNHFVYVYIFVIALVSEKYIPLGGVIKANLLSSYHHDMSPMIL